MSEKPLFQNIDEQERDNAPQQLPDGSPGQRAAALEGDEGSANAAVPAVTLAGGANTGGLGPSVGTTGTASGVAPAAGLAGLTGAIDDDDAARGGNESRA